MDLSCLGVSIIVRRPKKTNPTQQSFKS